MCKYFKCLIEILSDREYPQVVVFKDPQDVITFQRECLVNGQLINVKRRPMEYETTKGYIWLHQNSREYELSI